MGNERGVMDEVDISTEQLVSRYREFSLTKRVQFGRLVISLDREEIIRVVVYSK